MAISLQDQIKADFRSFDGLELGSYAVRLDDQGNYAFSSILFPMLGTRGTYDTETDLNNIGAGRETQVWHCLVEDVQNSFLSFPNPFVDARVRDRIIDGSGRTWEIWQVQYQSLSQRLRLTTLRVLE